MVHAYRFDPCWKYQRSLSLRQAQGHVLLLPYPTGVCVWWYTVPAVVCTRYDLCHSWHITVPVIHIPLEVSSIDTVCPVNSGSRVCAFQSWVILAWSPLSSGCSWCSSACRSVLDGCVGSLVFNFHWYNICAGDGRWESLVYCEVLIVQVEGHHYYT